MDGPIQLSFPLPRSLDTRIYMHLTVKAKSVVLLLTTASAEDAGTPPPLGSFVYALPDVCDFQLFCPIIHAPPSPRPRLYLTRHHLKLCVRAVPVGDAPPRADD